MSGSAQGRRRGFNRRRVIAALGASAALSGCQAPPERVVQTRGTVAPNRWARTFTITRRDGFTVVDFEARTVSWGGAAAGQSQKRRVVLAPGAGPAPLLAGDLAGAALVRTPVERIAVNYTPLEAMLTGLGVDDRLVAVGGVKSFNDAVRERTLRGELLQVGYGWHSAPSLDTLVASRPDVFLMAQMNTDHSSHLERIQTLGIPVMPIFMAVEPHYMGQVEYIRLLGLLTGREAQAEAWIRNVADRVDALKTSAAGRPARSLLHAWWAGGDSWMVTTRNADARLMRDANLELVMGQPDDPRYDSGMRVGLERLLAEGRDAEFWVARDPHASPYRDRRVLDQFRAFREGGVFALEGQPRPGADAYGLWEVGPIRPDLLLADYVKMAHPDLVPGPFTYMAPDRLTGAPA